MVPSRPDANKIEQPLPASTRAAVGFSHMTYHDHQPTVVIPAEGYTGRSEKGWASFDDDGGCYLYVILILLNFRTLI